MKNVKLKDGREYLLEDEDYELFKQLAKRGGLIELSNGDLINASFISHAGELNKRRFWGGYPLESDGENRGEYFYRDGDRIYLESHNYKEVEEMDDPKYQIMNKVKLLR